MKIALLGLPQTGKKTLFTLLTGRQIPHGRKPLEALEGMALIRDPRVDRLNELYQPERKVYAENHFVLCPDVAEGSENREWLDAARRCDLLCLVVRAFASDQIYHPAGSVDAARDRTRIENELLLADMERVDKRLERIDKEKRAGLTAEQQREEKTLRKCMGSMESGRRLRDMELDAQEQSALRSLELVTGLPQLLTYNVSESDLSSAFGPNTLTVSAQIEQEIMAMGDETERRDYLASVGLTASGVDRMNAAAYAALGLMSFYTVGKDEVRAWTIRKGSKAPKAGGKVHSDIERGFIRVEIMKYDELLAAGSEAALKNAGRVQLKGADYTIEDGDICHFLFNV